MQLTNSRVLLEFTDCRRAARAEQDEDSIVSVNSCCFSSEFFAKFAVNLFSGHPLLPGDVGVDPGLMIGEIAANNSSLSACVRFDFRNSKR